MTSKVRIEKSLQFSSWPLYLLLWPITLGKPSGHAVSSLQRDVCEEELRPLTTSQRGTEFSCQELGERIVCDILQAYSSLQMTAAPANILTATYGRFWPEAPIKTLGVPDPQKLNEIIYFEGFELVNLEVIRHAAVGSLHTRSCWMRWLGFLQGSE